MVFVDKDTLPSKEIKERARPYSSGAFIKCGDELIMYQRDDKPNIPHPGKVSIMGGAGESYEKTPEETLIREIEEELSIKIGIEQIQRLGLLVAGDDQNHDKYISLVTITPEQRAAIKKGSEGKELKYYKSGSLPKEEELTPDLAILFKAHRDNLARWLNGEDIIYSDLGLVKESRLQ